MQVTEKEVRKEIRNLLSYLAVAVAVTIPGLLLAAAMAANNVSPGLFLALPAPGLGMLAVVTVKLIRRNVQLAAVRRRANSLETRYAAHRERLIGAGLADISQWLGQPKDYEVINQHLCTWTWADRSFAVRLEFHRAANRCTQILRISSPRR